VFSPSEQFITQVKFRELRDQRDKSLAAYDQLARAAANAHDDASRLRLLYAGLREMQFAKQPLHPDVGNLELILRQGDGSQASSGTLTFWRAELERELRRGRLRADIVYLFGALLEEWTAGSADSSDSSEPGAPDALKQELVGLALADRDGSPHTKLLDELFTSAGLDSPELRQELRKTVDDAPYRTSADFVYEADGAEVSDLGAMLQSIAKDVYRPAEVRAEAQRFIGNPTLLKELSDALTIMLDHLDEWDWPEQGVPVSVRWVRTKWRLFTDEDLPTTCLLELLGERWQYIFGLVWEEVPSARVSRLQRLIELGAPDVLVQNEWSNFRQRARRGLNQGVDIWEDPSDPAAVGSQPRLDAPLADQLRYWGESNSIFAIRQTQQSKLRDLTRLRDYSSNRQVDESSLDAALAFLHAEIELARAAHPDRPLYVVKVDLKDYYPTLPHDLLLSILGRFGLTERELGFMRRYLRVRMENGRQTQIAHAGVPHHRRLSDLLGELVLRLMDMYVERAARVQVIRFIDDITLLAASPEEAVKGWEAVRSFCAACGLTLNMEKCGSVCVGGEALPLELPQRAPRWLLLTLDAQGRWAADAAGLEVELERARRQIAHASSILERVRLYNATLTHLEQSLAIAAPLGEAHRESVRAAYARCQNTLFGLETDATGMLRGMIRERFVGNGVAAEALEAWLFWPITAGGLGLRQAQLRAESYAEAFARRTRDVTPEERPDDWQRRSNPWARYYSSLLTAVSPIAPEPSAMMETLVKDFINRGAELSAGQQKTLSPYWRWILYIYGPQILESFGTFRFLFSELVPLQILTSRQSADGEADDA
jgi:reverse transcriptase-like protein